MDNDEPDDGLDGSGVREPRRPNPGPSGANAARDYDGDMGDLSANPVANPSRTRLIDWPELPPDFTAELAGSWDIELVPA